MSQKRKTRDVKLHLTDNEFVIGDQTRKTLACYSENLKIGALSSKFS